MKKTLSLFFVLLAFGCANDEGVSSSLVTTETIVKGRVYDVERKINVSGFRIVLARVYYSASSGFFSPGGYDSEAIDTVYTDENGKYFIKFDFIHGEQYGFIKQYYGSTYYTEHLYQGKIEEGEVNIRDINAWYATILKIKVSVANNNHPPFFVSNKVIDRDDLFFNVEKIYEKDTTSTVYLRTKPNSDIRLLFGYKTGPKNGDAHSMEEFYPTNLQDTISLSYSIDCSTF